jgi:hypothetical protein
MNLSVTELYVILRVGFKNPRETTFHDIWPDKQLIYIGNQSATVMYDGLGFDDILLNFDESAAVGSIKSRLC